LSLSGSIENQAGAAQKSGVIPAKAGIHLFMPEILVRRWIPAFAGMTMVVQARLPAEAN
jgi:hypothetical protein